MARGGGGKPWRRLVPGMVLTIEPGIYVRAADDVPKAFHDIGIRIEDDALLTAGGCELSPPDVPKAADEIEALMAERRNGRDEPVIPPARAGAGAHSARAGARADAGEAAQPEPAAPTAAMPAPRNGAGAAATGSSAAALSASPARCSWCAAASIPPAAACACRRRALHGPPMRSPAVRAPPKSHGRASRWAHRRRGEADAGAFGRLAPAAVAGHRHAAGGTIERIEVVLAGRSGRTRIEARDFSVAALGHVVAYPDLVASLAAHAASMRAAVRSAGASRTGADARRRCTR